MSYLRLHDSSLPTFNPTLAPTYSPHHPNCTSEIHYLELSSLSSPPSQISQPFLFITRSVLLLIESGALDPEREPGSGVSYGDRGGYLRRVRSGTGSAWSGRTGGVRDFLFSRYVFDVSWRVENGQCTDLTFWILIVERLRTVEHHARYEQLAAAEEQVAESGKQEEWEVLLMHSRLLSRSLLICTGGRSLAGG